MIYRGFIGVTAIGTTIVVSLLLPWVFAVVIGLVLMFFYVWALIDERATRPRPPVIRQLPGAPYDWQLDNSLARKGWWR